MSQRPGLWRLRNSERRFILLVGDLLVTVVSLLIALVIWAQKDWLNFSFQFLQERINVWFYLLPLLWILLMVELYDVRRAQRRGDILRGIAVAAGVCLGLYLLVFFLSEPNSLPRRGVAIFIVSCTILTIIWRLAYIRIFTAPLFMRRVLIVGAGKAGSTLAQVIKELKPSPFHLIGLIDDDPTKIGTLIAEYPVLAGSDGLMEIIAQQNISDLIFAISVEMRPETFQMLLRAEEQGVEVRTAATVYEELLGRVPIYLLHPDWILRSFVDEAHLGDFYEVTKRLMDIIGGLVGLVGLILVFPLVSILILLDSGRPIFYYQRRLGKNGRAYDIIKFRTMGLDAEADGTARLTVENDARINRVGRLLRKSHLDEFPQFINVLRGDISLVGPRAERPEIINNLQNKIPFYRARLLVRPGLTGWAQINQRYAATVEDLAVKLEYDLYYIKHRTLVLDFSILVRTFGTVFGLRGQ